MTGTLWVRLGGAWRPSLERLEVVFEAHEAIRGRRGASNGGRTKHSMLLIDFERILLPKINEKSMKFITKLMGIVIFRRFHAVSLF